MDARVKPGHDTALGLVEVEYRFNFQTARVQARTFNTHIHPDVIHRPRCLSGVGTPVISLSLTA